MDGTGQLRMRGADVLAAAQRHWRWSVSLNMVARITNLDQRQVRRWLVPGQAAERLNFSTLGLLCWFFGCQIDDLLWYERPDGTLPARPLRLLREEPPQAHPAPGAVQVIYRIAPATELIPYQVIVARTGWTPAFVHNLRRGQQGSLDRPMVGSLDQTTLVKLLAVLHAEQVRTLLQVQPTLAATATRPSDPEEVVQIILNRGLAWPRVVQRWRQLGGVAADRIAAPGMLGIDAAAIRYLYQHQLGAADQIPLQLGGQLAEAVQVSRAYIQQIVSGQRLTQHQPDALPAAVQDFLQAVLAGRPLDAWLGAGETGDDHEDGRARPGRGAEHG